MAEPMKIDVKIKHRLRVLMAEVGCRSVRELAEATGIAKNTLHLLDGGKQTNITLSNVFRLLWFFDCKFEDLFQGDITTNEPTSWNDLTDEAKRKITEAKTEYLAESERRKQEKESA